jgi:hypothetical protein
MAANSRTWLYNTLISNPALSAVIADRVLQQGSVLSAQRVKPYLVLHFGNNTDEGMADEDNFRPNRQFVQIYIHVEQGDYAPIDDIMDLVDTALTNRLGRPDNIVHIQYLETSQDLQDDLLQTYFRYMRYQLANSR